MQLHLHKVVVLDNSAFDRSERRGTLLHLRQRLIDILIGQIHFRHFNFKALVICKSEFRQDIKRRAELHRLAFLDEKQLTEAGDDRRSNDSADTCVLGDANEGQRHRIHNRCDERFDDRRRCRRRRGDRGRG